MAMSASAWAWCSQKKPAIAAADLLSDPTAREQIYTNASMERVVYLFALEFSVFAHKNISTRCCLHDQLQKCFSCNNIGAVPLREVISLRSSNYPPTLKKKRPSAFSVTKLINQSHLLMSTDISAPLNTHKEPNAAWRAWAPICLLKESLL